MGRGRVVPGQRRRSTAANRHVINAGREGARGEVILGSHRIMIAYGSLFSVVSLQCSPSSEGVRVHLGGSLRREGYVVCRAPTI